MNGSVSRDMSLTDQVVHDGEIRAMGHYTTTSVQVEMALKQDCNG